MNCTTRIGMLAVLTLGRIAWADIVFDQPATFPGGIASQNALNAFGAQYTAFDDFVLLTSTAVTGLGWQGAYSDSPTQPITLFQLGFWTDNAGLPGALLSQYDISGNGGESFVATNLSFFDYSYSVDLPAPFIAAANTKYWLSIQPTVDFPPQWFWRGGTGGDGVSAQVNLAVSPAPVLIREDSAFTLTGTLLPEPSLLWLTGLAGAILATLAWRRSHAGRSRAGVDIARG